MSGGRQVYITWDGGSVYFRGDRPDKMGLFVTRDGIDGWDSAPDTKVSMTERQTGDGAHDVQDSNVLYSARTVTVNFRAHGSNRDEVLGYIMQVAEATHRMVKIRIIDGSNDTYCEGYTQHSIDAEWNDHWGVGSLVVTCPRPERLSWNEHKITLFPTSSGSGGLFFGDEGKGLVFPMSFGTHADDARNVGTIVNNGSTRAYPLITVNGYMNGGFTFDFGSKSLSYSQPVNAVPLQLNSRTRIASIGGLDVSKNLTLRGFPVVEPGGSITVSLQAAGSGWATVTWRDSYI